MAKVLKFKEVNSDVESRMKDFEKIRIKLKAEVKKNEVKTANPAKEGKGLLKSISEFFSDPPKNAVRPVAKK